MTTNTRRVSVEATVEIDENVEDHEVRKLAADAVANKLDVENHENVERPEIMDVEVIDEKSGDA